METPTSTGTVTQPAPLKPWRQVAEESNIFSLPPEQRIAEYDKWSAENVAQGIKDGDFDSRDTFDQFKLFDIRTRKNLASDDIIGPSDEEVFADYKAFKGAFSSTQTALSANKPTPEDEAIQGEVLQGKRKSAFLRGQMFFNPAVVNDPQKYREAILESDAPSDIKMFYAGLRPEMEKSATVTRRRELANNVITRDVADRVVTAIQEGTELFGADIGTPQSPALKKNKDGIWSVVDPEYSDKETSFLGRANAKYNPLADSLYKPFAAINEYQQKYGLTDEQVQQDYMESLIENAPTSVNRWFGKATSIEEYVKQLDSTVRVKNKDVAPEVRVQDPNLFFDAEGYNAAVDKAKAPDEAKTFAKEARTQFADAVAGDIYNNLLNNRDDFREEYANNVVDRKGMEKAITRYYKDKKDQAWYDDVGEMFGQAGTALKQGGMDLMMMPSAIKGMFGDVEAAENYRYYTLAQKGEMQAEEAVANRTGGAGFIKLNNDVMRIIPDLVVQMGIAVATGGTLSGAQASLIAARTGISRAAATTALRQAAITGEKTALKFQLLRLIPEVTAKTVDDVAEEVLKASARTVSNNPFKGGIGTQRAVGSAYAGLTSASSTFGQVYTDVRNMGKSPEESIATARTAGIVAGAITSGLTHSFGMLGRGGVEDFASMGRKAGEFTIKDIVNAGMLDSLKTPEGRQLIRNIAKGISKDTFSEGAEEGLDQALNLISQYATNPSPEAQNRKATDVINESLYASLLGGFAGGFAASVGQARASAPGITAQQMQAEILGAQQPPVAPQAAAPPQQPPVAGVPPVQPQQPPVQAPPVVPVAPVVPSANPAVQNAQAVANAAAAIPNTSQTAAALAAYANEAAKAASFPMPASNLPSVPGQQQPFQQPAQPPVQAQAPTAPVAPVTSTVSPTVTPPANTTPEEEADYRFTKNAVISSQNASISFLQKRFRMGYGRAQEALERMEREGVIGPNDGKGSHPVLVAKSTQSTTQAPAAPAVVAPEAAPANAEKTPIEPTQTPAKVEPEPTENMKTARDTTKPEQMTPEEAISEALQKASIRPDEDSGMAARDRAMVGGNAEEFHYEKVREAIVDKLPVSSAAVDAYGITLPSGYVKQGELYVYQPEQKAEAVVEGTPEQKGIQGSVFESSMPKGKERVTGQYVIIEAGDLVTSFDPGFPKELQPRDRTRAASKEQISEIAINLAPERLGDSPTVDVGAPNIDDNGAVLSGNGRVTAIRANYESGGVDYKNWITQNAERFGFNAADIAAMKNPVLVRRISDYGKLSKEEFAVQANQSQVLSMSKGEKAKADALILLANTDLFSKFRPSEDGNVLVSTNREFIAGFVQETGAMDLLAADGSWTPDLGVRIQNAVLATMLDGDAVVIQNLIEDPSGYGLKKVSSALLLNAPNLIKLFGTDWSINQPLAQAIKDFISVKNAGQKVEEFLDQSMLFADPERTAVSDILLTKLFNAKSQKELNDFLSSYVARAENSVEDQRSGGLFGEQPRTVQQIVTDLTSNEKQPAEQQQDLSFGKPQAVPAKQTNTKGQKAKTATSTPEVKAEAPDKQGDVVAFIKQENDKQKKSQASAARGKRMTPGEARKKGIAIQIDRLGITSKDPASVIAALEKIAAKPSEKHHGRIAKDLLSVLKDSGVQIQLVSGNDARMAKHDSRVNGWYDPATNTAYINLDGPHELGIEETILHELVHASGEKVIQNPQTDAQKRILADLEKQMLAARKNAIALGQAKMGVDVSDLKILIDMAAAQNDYGLFDILYGVSSLSEYHAHATTSRSFQKFLATYKEGGKRSLMERFVNSITSLLSGKKTADGSDAEKAYATLLDLMREGKGDVRLSNADIVQSRARGASTEQDAEYLELAKDEEKNAEALQAMVNEAAKAAGGQLVFHGGDIEGDVIDVNRRERGAESERRAGTFYASSNPDAAKTYPGKQQRLFFFLRNPFRIGTPEMRPASWTGDTAVRAGGKVISKKTSLSIGEAVDRAKQFGYDGVIYDNIVDTGRLPSQSGKPPIGSTYVAFNSEQIKSAAPVTRDDNGNVIPLSQRFQSTSQDIRFSRARGRFDLVDAVRAASSGDASTPFQALNEAINANAELTRRIQAESERRSRAYARGKGAILEQIIRAGNTGRLPEEAIKPITDFVNSVSPQALADTRISLSAKPQNSTFDFVDSLVTLALNGMGSEPGEIDRTAIHEFWHGLSRFIPDDEIEKIRKDYLAAVKEYISENPWFVPFIGRTHLSEAQYDDLSRMLSKEEMDTIPWKNWETLEDGRRIRGLKWTKENYRLFRLDEWVAETMADLVRRKQERPTTFLGKMARMFRDFIDTLKQALGNPYLKALDAMTVPDEAFDAQIERYGPIEDNPPVMYGGAGVGMNNRFTLGMYAGEQALANMPEETRAFKRDSLEAARAMAAAGKTSEEIRAVTGWFPGKYDGKMRWEIPDAGAKWKAQDTKVKSIPLNQAISHPDLFAMYPQAKQIMVLFGDNNEDMSGGGYLPASSDQKYAEISLLAGRTGDKGLSTLLHEVQHFIQDEEGFSRGGNVFSINKAPLEYQRRKFDEFAKKHLARAESIASYITKRDFIKKAEKLTEDDIKLLDSEAKKQLENYSPEKESDLFRQFGTVWVDVSSAGSVELAITETVDDLELVSNLKNLAETVISNPTTDNVAALDRAVKAKGFSTTYQEAYWNVAGEIEARDVEARRSFTAEQRAATEPYSSENIAPDDAIVIFSRARSIVSDTVTKFAPEFNVVDDKDGPAVFFDGRNVTVNPDALENLDEYEVKDLSERAVVAAKAAPKDPIAASIIQQTDGYSAYNFDSATRKEIRKSLAKAHAVATENGMAPLAMDLGAKLFEYGGATDAEARKSMAKDVSFGERATYTAEPDTKRYSLPRGGELVGPAKFSIKAFHGTPKKVDSFSMKYVGAGEGTQFEGYGLYFAGKQKIGEWYRDNVAANNGELLRSALDFISQKTGGDPTEDYGYSNDSDYITLAESLGWKPPEGNLYTVELYVEDGDFLDWDKPLSEQSEKVKRYIDQQFDGLELADDFWEQTGEDFMQSMRDERGDKEASNSLLLHGIKGVRYLDGMSRKAGDGSFNYVIFDDKLIKILEENGTPVPQSKARGTASDEDARHAELEARAKAGDAEATAEAQAMVDAAAKAAGMLILYHGNTPFFGGFAQTPLGIHLGSLSAAKDRLLQTEQRNGVVSRYAVTIKRAVRLAYDPDTWGALDVWKSLPDAVKNAVEDNYEYQISDLTLEELQIELDALGFDGIEYPNAFEGIDDSFVAFARSQIKSADPFTYDDAGNLIPFSQRFQPESPDIRYSRARGVDLVAYVPRNRSGPRLAVAKLFAGFRSRGMVTEDAYEIFRNSDAYKREIASFISFIGKDFSNVANKHFGEGEENWLSYRIFSRDATGEVTVSKTGFKTAKEAESFATLNRIKDYTVATGEDLMNRALGSNGPTLSENVREKIEQLTKKGLDDIAKSIEAYKEEYLDYWNLVTLEMQASFIDEKQIATLREKKQQWMKALQLRAAEQRQLVDDARKEAVRVALEEGTNRIIAQQQFAKSYLPDDLVHQIERSRAKIDELSGRLTKIEWLMDGSQLQMVIDAKTGVYVTRSYEAFETNDRVGYVNWLDEAYRALYDPKQDYDPLAKERIMPLVRHLKNNIIERRIEDLKLENEQRQVDEIMADLMADPRQVTQVEMVPGQSTEGTEYEELVRAVAKRELLRRRSEEKKDFIRRAMRSLALNGFASNIGNARNRAKALRAEANRLYDQRYPEQVAVAGIMGAPNALRYTLMTDDEAHDIANTERAISENPGSVNGSKIWTASISGTKHPSFYAAVNDDFRQNLDFITGAPSSKTGFSGATANDWKRLGDKILEHKNDVPAFLRTFLGERDNPLLRVSDTLLKQSHLIAVGELFQNLSETGQREGWLVNNELRATDAGKYKGWDTILTSEQTDQGYEGHPFKGLYADPVMADAIRVMLAANQPSNTAFKAVAKIVGFALWGVTAGSVKAIIRNLLSAPSFLLNSGFLATILNPRRFRSTAQNVALASIVMQESMSSVAKVSGGKKIEGKAFKLADKAWTGLLTFAASQRTATGLMKGVGTIGELATRMKVKPTSEAAQQFYSLAVRLGVANDNVQKEAMERLLSLEETISRQPRDKNLGRFAKTLKLDGVVGFGSYLLGTIKSAGQQRSQLYGAPDDFTKILAWLNEMDSQARINAKDDAQYKEWKGADGLFTNMPENLVKLAADHTTDTIQSHSKVWAHITQFKKVGFGVLLAPFVAARAEFYRNAINSYRIGFQELRSKNGKERSYGAMRIASAVLAHTAYAKAAGIVLSMIFKAMADDDDVAEDSPEKREAIRKLGPEYAKNKNATYVVYKNGTFDWLDISFSDPFSFVSSSLNAARRGIDEKAVDDHVAWSVAKELMAENFGTFVSPQIAVGASATMISGYDPVRGIKIWDSQADTTAEKVQKAIAYYMKQAGTPGDIKSAMNIIKAARGIEENGRQYKLGTEIGGVFLGASVRTIKVTDMVEQKLAQAKDNLNTRVGALYEAQLRDSNDVDMDDVVAATETYHRVGQDAIRRMQKVWKAGETLLSDTPGGQKMLRGTLDSDKVKMSKEVERAIVTGKQVPSTVSDQTMQKIETLAKKHDDDRAKVTKDTLKRLNQKP